MSYPSFEHRIRSQFGKSVLNVYHEDGKHIAKLAGGIRIVGNNIARSVYVTWGSGHSAITAI